MSTPTQCKLCGAQIEFRDGPNGKPIPLQRVRTVYALNASLAQAVVKVLPMPPTLYVSHFETCPEVQKGKRP